MLVRYRIISREEVEDRGAGLGGRSLSFGLGLVCFREQISSQTGQKPGLTAVGTTLACTGFPMCATLF